MLAFIQEQRGSIAVLTVLAMTAFLGMAAVVIDIGVLYMNKVQLSNMADAAALAGVQDLPGNVQLASSNANRFARQNGKNGDVIETAVNADQTTITVTVSRTVTLFFAKVFHITSSNVSATAVAAIKPISAVQGTVPFGVVKQNFVYGQTYTLKEGGGSGDSGNYGGLSLGGNGASTYRKNIEYGYNGNLYVGQWVSTEPGNMSGPTDQGISYRIGQDTGATFETVDKNSPRIVIVPILDSLDVHGRKEVQIVGFAAFFLEGVGGSGKDNYVSGKFMQLVVAGEVSATTSSYGLYGASLIR